jgi:prephenate dehydratase
LKEFADRNINLTKIESRPTKSTPWEYHFYLDFEGHRTETKCQQALEAIKDKTVFIKILGSYKAANKPNFKL